MIRWSKILVCRHIGGHYTAKKPEVSGHSGHQWIDAYDNADKTRLYEASQLQFANELVATRLSLSEYLCCCLSSDEWVTRAHSEWNYKLALLTSTYIVKLGYKCKFNSRFAT